MKIKNLLAISFFFILALESYAACPARSEYFSKRFPEISCNGVRYYQIDLTKVVTLMYDFYADVPSHNVGEQHTSRRRFFILENGKDLPCVRDGCTEACINAWNAWREFQRCYPEYLDK